MAEATEGDPPKFIPTDPDNVPIRVVNGSFGNVFGSICALTLVSNRIGFDAKGDQCPEMVVAARLRFDLEMAKIIRDQLDVQIGLLSKPQGQAN